MLNGKLLELDPESGAVPDLIGHSATAAEPLSLPARSYGFVLFPDAGIAACAT